MKRFFRPWVWLCCGCGMAAAEVDLHRDLERLREGHPMVPGIAAAVVKDGEIVALGVAGVRKAGTEEAVEKDDRFHIGSCTKSMTAVLAALLVKEGKMKWETEAGQVYKGAKGWGEGKKATLEQLVSNSGGFPRDFPGDLWEQCWKEEWEPMKQRRELVKEFMKRPLAYTPGEGWEYSNGGFTVAGAMMEETMRKPYEVLLKEKLFVPLQMDSAGFGAPGRLGKQPLGHRLQGEELVAVVPGSGDDNPAAISPAGRVHLSIRDFARYARFHLDGDPKVPLSEEERKDLWRVRPPSKDYALGWSVQKRGWSKGEVITHNGTNRMNFAVMWLAPVERFGVVVACNSGEGAALCDAVAAEMIRRFQVTAP